MCMNPAAMISPLGSALLGKSKKKTVYRNTPATSQQGTVTPIPQGGM